MSTKAERLIVRPRILRDQILFFSAFIIGAAATVVIKEIGASAWIVMLVPVCIILVYACLAYLDADTAMEPDVIGDNCYYLGFILTLVSLAWTLYAVSKAPDNLDLVKEIISGFGVALSSTITGIFMRALFLQLRPDVVTAERKARQEILDATREFRTELSQSIMELKDFSRNVQQALSEHQTNLTEYSKTAVDKHNEWIKIFSMSAAKQASTLYQTAMGELQVNMNKTAVDATSVFKKSLDTSHNELEKWFENAASRINVLCVEIDSEVKRITESISKLDESASSSAEEIKKSSSIISQGMKKVATTFDKNSTKIIDETIRFGTEFQLHVGKAIQSLSKSANDISASLSLADDSAANTISLSASQLVDQISLFTDQIKSATDKFSNEVNSSADEFKNAKEFVSDSVQALKGVSDGALKISSVFDEAEKKISELKLLPTRADVDASVNALAKTLDAMNTCTLSLSRGVDEANRTIKSLEAVPNQTLNAANALSKAATQIDQSVAKFQNIQQFSFGKIDRNNALPEETPPEFRPSVDLKSADISQKTTATNETPSYSIWESFFPFGNREKQ